MVSVLFFAAGRLGTQVAIAMAGHRMVISPRGTNTILSAVDRKTIKIDKISKDVENRKNTINHFEL